MPPIDVPPFACSCQTELRLSLIVAIGEPAQSKADRYNRRTNEQQIGCEDIKAGLLLERAEGHACSAGDASEQKPAKQDAIEPRFETQQDRGSFRLKAAADALTNSNQAHLSSLNTGSAEDPF